MTLYIYTEVQVSGVKIIKVVTQNMSQMLQIGTVEPPCVG